MNTTITQLQQHTSIRRYKDEPIAPSILEAIIAAVQQAPSWINGQQVTIIRVTDKEKREKLMALAGNQPYVAQAPEFFVFCLDFYRAYEAAKLEGTEFAVEGNIDLLLVGATDVGIALGTAVVAAESFGLGTVAIGGVRKSPTEVIELLELPPYVYPVSGLCIGYPDEAPALKPRLPQEAQIFNNAYDRNVAPHLHVYNEQFSAYMSERTNGENSTNWTSGIAGFYGEPRYRGNGYADAAEALKQQKLLK
ncbi:NADPH-dependent oxidoreductase [Caryophanon latum]|uniref:NADPH-dependent oxidoreductase n=1 Tax=Caryophanon latum TaxID=33977 RepID=A0A1C0YTJ9_9BACL|nr:NADPH-dependent oxidoreductase [Caryophanon latum]OCS90496.1 NADPH-dependent oxidoreductase [Caryophanon latum]